jgi:hypothetical protein
MDITKRTQDIKLYVTKTNQDITFFEKSLQRAGIDEKQLKVLEQTVANLKLNATLIQEDLKEDNKTIEKLKHVTDKNLELVKSANKKVKTDSQHFCSYYMMVISYIILLPLTCIIIMIFPK